MKKHARRAAPAAQSVKKSGKRARHTDPALAEGLQVPEVLDLLARVPHPMRMDDILRFLDLSRRAKGPLHDLLADMETQGKVLRLSGGRWAGAGHAPLITGLLSIQRSGAGFVSPDGPAAKAGRQDIFIAPSAMGDAWHGDRVEVISQPPRERGRGRGRGNDRAGGRSGGRSGPSPEGRIVRVVERRQKELPAHALRTPPVDGRILCRPADARFPFLLLVDISELSAPPRPGDLLLVAPGERLEDNARARVSGREGEAVWEGKACASLGREDDVSVQERLVKLNHLIPLDFPPNVEAEAASLHAEARQTMPPYVQAGTKPDGTGQNQEAPFRNTAERLDLRGIPFVTIDGADARDFDDAIHVARLAAGWELRVAIADVSSFVRPGSALDKEARSRGNSCYFPASVEPMLPEALSNDLCSLRPDEDRLVMTARIRFDATGKPREAVFAPGLIRSRARLTYEEVQAAFDSERTQDRQGAMAEAQVPEPAPRENASREAVPGDTPDSREAQTAQGPAPSELLQRLPDLRHARDLALALQAQREARGSLDFDLPEAAFNVDRTSGRVTGIIRRQRLFAHRLIEECMLAANEAVARFLSEQGTPFPYRVHPAPDRERLESLFRTLGTTGLAPELSERGSLSSAAGRSASGGQEANNAALSARLRKVLAEGDATPQAFLVNRLVLRAMMQARYAPENDGHFGLASACYCHFTSPIRRYADLLVHRALRFTLERGQRERSQNGTPILTGQKLLAVCDQCNTRERVAVEAEREITRRLACLVLREHVGESFTGVISGVTDFGFFVEFDAMPAEGMVRLESLDDHFVYDPDRQELLGLASGQRFRLGDTAEVRLTDVHVGRLEVNLELSGLVSGGKSVQSRRPRAQGSGRNQNNPGRSFRNRTSKSVGIKPEEGAGEGGFRRKGRRKSAGAGSDQGRSARRR